MSYATGTSLLEQWTGILWAIESSPWPHERILDVGAGYGKAAVLLREYLNVKPEEIDAVEPNLSALCHEMWSGSLYGTCWAYDIRTFETTGDYGLDRYDTVLMADVIEHLPKDDGAALLARIPGQIIVSTPVNSEVELHAQTPGIPELERHVSQWTVPDFRVTRRLHSYWFWPQTASRQLIVRLCPKGREGGWV